jgi:hypothetical protein
VALCYAVLDPIVFWIVFSVTIFCAFCFFVTAMWSWAEWLVYQRHEGTKWLAGILSAYREQMWKTLPVEKIKSPGRRFYRYVIAGFKACSRFLTAFRTHSHLRRLEKQNEVLPTVVRDEMPSGLSDFVNATKTAIKKAILDHRSDSSDTAWELESSDPVVIMDDEARAPWFWGCAPDGQPRCLMLKITGAHPDMVRCVSISSLNSSFIPDAF